MAKKRRRIQPKFFLFVTILLALVAGVIVVAKKLGAGKQDAAAASGAPIQTPSAEQTTTTPTPAPPLPDGLTVQAAEEASAALFGFSYELKINGDDVTSFSRAEPISFRRRRTIRPLRAF